MKPFKIFYILLTTNLMVLSCALIFPSEGLQIKDFTLRFLNLNEWAYEKPEVNVDIAEILPDFNLNDLASDTSLLAMEEPGETKDFEAIEFNRRAAKEFAVFFEKLAEAKNENEPLRILHYGDSQIEGDRITSVLREQLQAEYGGSGPGMVPVNEPNHSRSSIKIDTRGNWVRKQVFGPRGSQLAGNSYGVLGFSHSFSNAVMDTQQTDTAKAQIFLSPMYTAFKRASDYTRLKVLYRNYGFGQLAIDGVEMAMDTSGKPVIYARNVSNTGKHQIDFANDFSAQVYAVIADDSNGVAVDNIAVRGSSGLVFTKMDAQNLADQYRLMNVGMIIYQYGVNVVPYIRDDYSFYQKQVSQQLLALKKLNPGVPILVIGASDMSRKEDGNYESYPNIPLIVEAQSGCAFWNLYGAMGGNNSMPAWVNAKPALAQADYIHFTQRGANVVGQKLHQALKMFQYDLELVQ